MNLQESIRRILREDEYTPAGKEITPNKIVIHKSNPMFRDNILMDGLRVKSGECYKIYVGYGIKCKPAIFATNSTNKRAWFDSTYDDDIWEINTEMIPDVMWYKDRHYFKQGDNNYHIVTFKNISPDCLELIHKGTGKSY
jgi:endo-1,4-beta-mannosidase